ncbi:MAG: 4Fe-4S dicluster domain-containing protein [Desulfobacterales bacterium]
MTTINPDFLDAIEEYGIEKARECFNCGTCTAICPLVHEHFPRRMIRYLQLGARDRIVENARELWRCLHCGLCTQTCPRGADPGEVILGLKRFVVATWRRPTHV